MTTSELAKEVFSIVEAKVLSRPSALEFEMAYQARLATERIRFAIKVSEKARQESTEALESGLQLLEALDYLEAIDRRFQQKCRAAHVAMATMDRISTPRGCNVTTGGK